MEFSLGVVLALILVALFNLFFNKRSKDRFVAIKEYEDKTLFFMEERNAIDTEKSVQLERIANTLKEQLEYDKKKSW